MANPMELITLIQRAANNPNATIQDLCRQRPDLAKDIDNLIGAGNNPKQVVLSELQRRGVNPQAFMNMLGNMKF